MIDEIIDGVTDFFSYIFSFEWFSDVWDFIGSMFENIGQFSVYGVAFGLVGFGTVFLAKDYMLTPFLIHMGSFEAFFWMIATYIGCFVAGYLIGCHFENT